MLHRPIESTINGSRITLLPATGSYAKCSCPPGSVLPNRRQAAAKKKEDQKLTVSHTDHNKSIRYPGEQLREARMSAQGIKIGVMLDPTPVRQTRKLGLLEEIKRLVNLSGLGIEACHVV